MVVLSSGDLSMGEQVHGRLNGFVAQRNRAGHIDGCGDM